MNSKEMIKEFSQVDLKRRELKGYPEIIYGAHKTASQILAISKQIDIVGQPVLITRLSKEKYLNIKNELPKGTYYEGGEIFYTRKQDQMGKGNVLILSAGTSDYKVVEEAAVTSEWLGCKTEIIQDVGVAGIHRLLSKIDKIRQASVIIVVAGMEGALPSVVSGLVEVPLIAVPTSVGYGANLEGITTLLAMTTSCSSGVSIVNIDNGFGAAYQAALIIKLINKEV
ncbi:nickel pincer cofactor biosynthesis protein LarB [Streptococcus moroccensis]|uniref:NCAIR mutase (PurE)-related protein n=1 Tax=Streptococcus moroccensis TaxID=1451356 RepID=A0ABT9YRG5_9STRE|nr:nickel pincer cofactor biosynthesis protein LarB [Streptococcus moroccensis]MDQ0222584.1 NCAIR mutase (PurE)-related protein [Streptococcus moroccensis]